MKKIFFILILTTLNILTSVSNTNMNLYENINRMKTLMGLNEELISIENKLKKGDRGQEVEVLQDLLGIYSDGIFGPQTEKCVSDFQESKKIEDENGVVGIETIRFLQKLKDGTDTWETPEYCKNRFFNKTLSNKVDKSSGVKSIEEPEKDLSKPTSDGDGQVILMGGLDYRQGDKTIDQQVEVIKKSTGLKNVIGHRYMKINDVLESIKQNPDAHVILFSAGCRYSNEIASAMKDKTKLFIVEPYAASSSTANSVKNAVSAGVPSKNVVVGPSKGRGSGVVSGATNTPQGIGHWDALEYVGSLF